MFIASITDVLNVVVWVLLGGLLLYGLLHALGTGVATVMGTWMILRSFWDVWTKPRIPSVVGTVVGHHEEGVGPELRYAAEIRYRLPDGREFQIRSRDRRDWRFPAVGTEVHPTYDPAKPGEAVVDWIDADDRRPPPAVRPKGRLPP